MQIAIVGDIGTSPPKETDCYKRKAIGRRMKHQKSSHASSAMGLILFLSAQSVVNLIFGS